MRFAARPVRVNRVGGAMSADRQVILQKLPLRRSAVKRQEGRVEDGRGGLGHAATPRFPSPLIEPDVPISGIRLSDWLHRGTHGKCINRTRHLHGE